MKCILHSKHGLLYNNCNTYRNVKITTMKTTPKSTKAPNTPPTINP